MSFKQGQNPGLSGVVFEEGDNVLSMYQKVLMEEGEHPLQQHAVNMLEMMGILVPKGGMPHY